MPLFNGNLVLPPLEMSMGSSPYINWSHRITLGSQCSLASIGAAISCSNVIHMSICPYVRTSNHFSIVSQIEPESHRVYSIPFRFGIFYEFIFKCCVCIGINFKASAVYAIRCVKLNVLSHYIDLLNNTLATVTYFDRNGNAEHLSSEHGAHYPGVKIRFRFYLCLKVLFWKQSTKSDHWSSFFSSHVPFVCVE